MSTSAATSSYHTSVTALLQCLQEGNRSYADLAMWGQMTEQSVRKWIAAWREAKLVHVSGWNNDARGYPTIMLFSWNPGAEDVSCPAMTITQRISKWRDRKKKGLV